MDDVTDSTSWQPPVSGASTPPPSPFAAPPSMPSAPNAGWTPPPKPGLIPLRPLTLGTILAAPFRLLRKNPRPLLAYSLLLTGAVSLLTLASVGGVTYLANSRISNATSKDAAAIGAGNVFAGILSILVPVIFSIIVSVILEGIVIMEVSRATLGEKLTFAGLWRGIRGRVGALIGWAAIATAATLVALLVLGGLITIIVIAFGPAGVVIGVLLGIVAFLGGIVVATWLSTRLSFVSSALVLERLPLREAIRRSWSLSIGFFWKTLGIHLLVAFILQTAISIISFPIQLAVMLTSGVLEPNGETNPGTAYFIFYGLSLVVTVITGAIATVVESATIGLIYLDIRMRKEGLDMELAHFVEARQAGDSTLADPYLSRPGATTVPPVAAPGSPWA